MEQKLDIDVQIGDCILNCRAVAFIVRNGKILLQKRKNDKVWTLIGGKIKIGEHGRDSLKREIKEEIGVDVEVGKLINVAEYFFDWNEKSYHQYIFGYDIKIIDHGEILDNEEFDGIEIGKYIICKWFDISDLDSIPIKPDFLKEQLLNINKGLVFTVYEDFKN